MSRGLLTGRHIVPFCFIFMKTRELSLLIWKIYIVRPNTQGLTIFIFQVSKQRHRELSNFPKEPQQAGGRAGLRTQVCVIWKPTCFTTDNPITLITV